MITYPWCMWFGLAAFIGTMLTSILNLALSDLSGGTLRKLELSEPEMARTFRGWLEQRSAYRIGLRLLQVALAAVLVLAGAGWLEHAQRQGTAIGAGVVGSLILLIAVHVFTVELVGCDLSAASKRHLLKVSIPTMRLLMWVTAPLAIPLAWWHRVVARQQKSALEGEEQTTTEDEIMSLVEKDAEEDEQGITLEEDERRMIRGIFDLDETLVRAIMTPRVDLDALPDTASVAELKQEILGTGHSRIPIYGESIDHIVGILHAKDLLDSDRISQPDGVRGMLHAPLFIPETKNIGDLLEEFQQNVTHFAVVVDEYGGTAGIVTLEDILEEIVGEIMDEYDREEDEPVRHMLPGGGMIVDARTSIDELNQEMQLHLPDDEDFDTIGGYVSSVLGRIPKAGEVLTTDHFVLEVLEADDRRILKAKLQPILPDGPDSTTRKDSHE